MNPATAAQERRHAAGYDYDLSFELAEWEAEQEAEDVDAMTTEQRQALNARMFEYFNG